MLYFHRRDIYEIIMSVSGSLILTAHFTFVWLLLDQFYNV